MQSQNKIETHNVNEYFRSLQINKCIFFPCLSVSQLVIVHRAHFIANINNINRNNIYKYIYVRL